MKNNTKFKSYYFYILVQRPNWYFFTYTESCVPLEFFDELRSTEPAHCKTNECYFLSLEHFPKTRQIKNDGFLVGLPQGKILMSTNIVKLYMVGWQVLC